MLYVSHVCQRANCLSVANQFAQGNKSDSAGHSSTLFPFLQSSDGDLEFESRFALGQLMSMSPRAQVGRKFNPPVQPGFFLGLKLRFIAMDTPMLYVTHVYV